MSIDPQRVYSSASGFLPASAAAARMISIWAARWAAVSLPPAKYPSPRRPARRAAAWLDPRREPGGCWR
jgi:hypothetical protein